jgi:hypothetical protein
MMSELDKTLRDDLARLRAQAGPSERARQRMWTALERQVDPGSDPDDGSPESGPSDAGLPGSQLAGTASQAGFAAKVVAATLGLTGAGLLTLRAGVLAIRALTPSEPVETRHDSIAHEAIRADDERGSTPEPAVSTSASAPVLTPSRVAAGQPESAASQPEPAGPPEPAPTRVDNSLAAELALLQVAHDAHSPKLALEALDEHLQRFPDGQLADERELLRVRALCTLGRLDAARISARALIQHHAAMTSRVHEVCPKLALDDSNAL